LALQAGILPFRQFVLKVHSRCDLACDHCYVYEHADQSWRARPPLITQDTVTAAGRRIAEHAARHGLPSVRVILHGGEPLLAGAPRLAEIAGALRAAVSPDCLLDLRLQTNGMLLDEEFCTMFAAMGIKVGISLDGDRAANDLHRRYASGRSSYDQAIRAVSLLRTGRFRGIYAGLLCTVDIRADPVASYRALADLDPPAIDFLLPHATWDRPPPRGTAATPYADWLAAAFDEWTADGRRVSVRAFESIMATTRGGASGTESLGLEPSDVLVIETDGTIEQADSLKVAYDGAPATGLDVFRHDLDAAAAHPGIRARQHGIAGLCATCQACPVVASCGGGLYAHRYRAGSGFGNPSVYCADLKAIITHVRSGTGPPAASSAAAGAASATAAAQPAPRLELPAADFDALASGYGDGGSVAHLVRAERGLYRMLLRLLHERAADTDRAFLASWDLLLRAQRHNPAAVAEVLAHPYVRVWAEQCLRAGDMPGERAVRDRQQGEGGIGHLAAIAAAAAVRSGTRAELAAPVTGEYLCLPTLGRLRVGRVQTATVVVDPDGFAVRAPSGTWHVTPDGQQADPAWEPVRELRAGQFAVRLDDSDPYRDCYQLTVAPRLADLAERWQVLFSEAWRLIEAQYPDYATGIAAGLTTITPLEDRERGQAHSVTARAAFGAIATTLPADGEAFALAIIHESQHAKLGVLLDLFELCDPTDRRLFYAPWRDDPRPVEALLQGAYAHLGVTDYWRLRRHRTAGEAMIDAAERFARWRALTAEAIETLAGSGALTSLGQRFVAGMHATVTPWLDEPVPGPAEAAARRWISEHRQAWQLLQTS
jgi:uncharacterized protein